MKALEANINIFRTGIEVLKMLKKEGKINDAIIENLLSWRHTEFYVYLNIRRFRLAGPACYACTGAL